LSTALQRGILVDSIEEAIRSNNHNFQGNWRWKGPRLYKSILIPLRGD